MRCSGCAGLLCCLVELRKRCRTLRLAASKLGCLLLPCNLHTLYAHTSSCFGLQRGFVFLSSHHDRRHLSHASVCRAQCRASLVRVHPPLSSFPFPLPCFPRLGLAQTKASAACYASPVTRSASQHGRFRRLCQPFSPAATHPLLVQSHAPTQ